MSITLSPYEITKLEERGFKKSSFLNGQNVSYWKSIAKQPLAFYYKAKKETFMKELDGLNIPYSSRQSKSDLQQLLLDNENNYFRIMCTLSGSGFSVLFTCNKNTTGNTILSHFNSSIKDTNFPVATHLSMNGNQLEAGVKVESLSHMWKLNTNTEKDKNIIEINVF